MHVNLEYSRGNQPLYVQLANAIEDYITLENMQPGDLLPSESTLATENRLSRATIMKAYDLLIERGRITRRQGKGTFVRAKPMERMLPELTSFSEHVHGLGLTPSSSLLAFEIMPARASNRPVSAFADNTDLVVLERLRSVNGTVVGLQRVTVALDVADRIGLDEHSAAKPDFSLYSALRTNGIYLNGGEETLRAINADERDAALLGVDEGTALIEVTRESRDTADDLIEIVRARYLGSQYLYHISFAPSTSGGPHETHNSSTTHRSGGGLAAAAQRLRD